MVNYASVISSLVSIALLIWFFSGPWKRLMTDLARQRLFEIRDDLFDLAVEGNISFKSKEYVGIRDNLNLYIRNCHRISFVRMLIARNISYDNTKSKTVADFVENINDEDIRKKVASVTQDLPLVLNNLMINRSVWMMLIAILALPFFLVHFLSESHWQNIKDKFTNNSSRLEKNMAISA